MKAFQVFRVLTLVLFLGGVLSISTANARVASECVKLSGADKKTCLLEVIDTDDIKCNKDANLAPKEDLSRLLGNCRSKKERAEEANRAKSA